MGSVISALRRLYMAFNPPSVPPTSDSKPIKFGILGAAAIAPAVLTVTGKNHPEVVVCAIAARDKSRAVAFAKRYQIPKAYWGRDGYQELLDDPDVDVVYNPLPNGHHYEWTMKALAAGKHVLLEKPSTNTAEETRKIFDYAQKKGLVVLEAFHYRFHPAIQRVKRILDSGELGTIKEIHTSLAVPHLAFRKGDIRFNYALGGGSLMDMGCYTISVSRYLASSDPSSVVEATAHRMPSEEPDSPSLVDRGMEATLAFPNSIIAKIRSDLAIPSTLIPAMPDMKVLVKCERGLVELYNYILPTIYHRIQVTAYAEEGEKPTVKSFTAYQFEDGEGKGEEWWTTYRYQLEAFVDKLKGRTPQTWVSAEDSVANIHWIEQVYAKSGLGSRPKSDYVPAEDPA